MVQGLVPLCSWQYERVFNTTRIPGMGTDRLQHLDDSTWIAVYHKGRYYSMPVYYKNRLMEPAELQGWTSLNNKLHCNTLILMSTLF